MTLQRKMNGTLGRLTLSIYNPARYALAHNELINRGLINSQSVNLNDYNINFGDNREYINIEKSKND